MIVPYPAGRTTDFLGRLIAAQLKTGLGDVRAWCANRRPRALPHSQLHETRRGRFRFSRSRRVPLKVLDVEPPGTAVFHSKLVLSRPDQHVA
jgi:hypothetical protein